MELSQMTIKHALQEKKTILKKIEQNRIAIEKYSSQPDNEKEYLGDEETQRNEVKALVQSSEDLILRYMEVSSALERTNLATKVKMNSGFLKGGEFCLSDLIRFKQKLEKAAQSTYLAMSDSNANSMRMRSSHSASSKNKIFYDEKVKNSRISALLDFCAEINVQLDIANATTTLVVD